MLHLITGRAGSGKTASILRSIRERGEAGGKSILMVPEQYSHEAERELLRLCGDGVSLYAEVLSFTRLALRVSRELGSSARHYADKPGRLLQMALALSAAEGGLSVYGGGGSRADKLRPLLRALDELRYNCITPAMLRSAAGEVSPQLRGKLMDLSLLQEAMDALGDRGGNDPLSRMDILCEQLPQSALPKENHIYIDGFTDFTLQERQVIRELCKLTEVTVCLGCESLTDFSEEFALPVKTAVLLRSAAEEDGIPAEVILRPSPPSDDALELLEENLFSYTPRNFDSQGRIHLTLAGTVSEECELCAGEILRLLRETDCRYRDIAIAVRGFGAYRSVLESTFRRYELPLYTAEKTGILHKALPTVLLSAFAILDNGWNYEDMFSYLKTGLGGLSREECDELENYVLLWDIRGNAWRAEKPWRQHPDGYNQKVTPETEERLSRIDALRRRAAAPLLLLEEKRNAAHTALEHCRATADFWEALELEAQLDAHNAELRALHREQEAQEAEQLYDTAAEALEQCARILGSLPMDNREFARLFTLLLGEYSIGTIPVSVDRISAGDFDRMRRRHIRHLFILGSTDERLPSVNREAGVFTGSERDQLRSLRLSIEDEDDSLNREFSLIYNVLSLPSDTLWLSRPLTDADGSETRPSFVTERVMKLFSLREKPGDLLSARSSARAPAFALACSGNKEALAAFSGDEERSEKLSRLRQSAQAGRGRLGSQGVQRLYGTEPRLSASRVDTFAACKFQYFLRYGLKAKPRQSAGFDPPALGTFLHYILECCARECSEKGGFAVCSDEELREMAARYTEEYVHTELQDFREKSTRFIYLFRRLRSSVEQIVLDAARELRRSDFQPLDFELNFSHSEGLPPLHMGQGEDGLILTGTPDRVDGWEHEGKLYLRIIDYKSGSKKFSLTDVWYGMGLQMLLYLFALGKEGEKRYGKPIAEAGVLYVPARDDLIKAPKRLTDEEILAQKTKELKRSGLLLAEESVIQAMEHGEDGFRYLPVRLNKSGEAVGDALATAEELGQLSAYIEELLGNMARELKRGSIAADPWFRSESESACVNCSYYDACHFDEAQDKRRYKVSLKAPEFWAKLREREAER